MRCVLFVCLLFAFSAPEAIADDAAKEIQTPQQALDALMAGNARFLSGERRAYDFASQIERTAAGQAPFAAVLSCLDSRVPVEIIFDQGIGDIFVGRVAGNIEDIHILGSFEFAKHIKGTKLLMVLGHTNCGAVAGACNNAKLGNLTQLLFEIQPAVSTVQSQHDAGVDICVSPWVDAIAEENVRDTLDDIRGKSPVIADLEAAGRIMLVGAMYDVATGKVRLLDPPAGRPETRGR